MLEIWHMIKIIFNIVIFGFTTNIVYFFVLQTGLKKCSGIPLTFLKEVDDCKTPGAMVTATGKFVVPR